MIKKQKGAKNESSDMDKAFYTKERLPVITEDIRKIFTDKFDLDILKAKNSGVLVEKLAKEIQTENPEYLNFVDDFVRLYPNGAQSPTRLILLNAYALLKTQAWYYNNIKGLEKRIP